MIIQQNYASLGATVGTDPNSPSFHSQNWFRSAGRRNPLPHEEEKPQNNSVSIGSHSWSHSDLLTANLTVGNAISFSQTEDAFLRKAQESLQRMGELSVQAQAEGQSETDRQKCGDEFVQLQTRIRAIESKMIDTIGIFADAALQMTLEVGEMVETEEMVTFGRIPLHDYLGRSADPKQTGIADGKTASDASSSIRDALKAITSLRTQVSSHIQELCQTGEEIVARMDHGTITRDSTESARSNILAKSAVAILAQANALPGSTLRLLG